MLEASPRSLRELTPKFFWCGGKSPLASRAHTKIFFGVGASPRSLRELTPKFFLVWGQAT